MLAESGKAGAASITTALQHKIMHAKVKGSAFLLTKLFIKNIGL
jgi:hypothetical protein